MSTPTAAYPKAMRLRRAGEFRRLLARGDVHPGRQALVRRLENGLQGPRLGISTPRRYGKAVIRNRFRRLVREAFRNMAKDLGPYDYLVSPRRHLETPTLEGMVLDFRRSLTHRPAPPRRRAPGRGPAR